MDNQDALSISFAIADESPEIIKLLAIGYRANGSMFAIDTGMSVEETKEMCAMFISWKDRYMGPDIECTTQDG